MSWKSLDQIYLEKSAFKSIPNLPRHIVNEANVEEIINMIKELDKQGLFKDSNDLEKVKAFLSKKPFSKKVKEYLTGKNLSEKTIGQGDIREIIIDVLSEYGDIAKFASYIENPVDLKAIGMQGRLEENISKATGLKKETAERLINLIGSESGRGVGRGEIALATVFDDVKMSLSKGDLDWDGKYLEVKGSAARCGKRDRASTNFTRTNLGKLTQQYNIDTRAAKERLDIITATLADQEGLDRNVLFDALNDFVNTEYPHSSYKLPQDINLSSPIEVRNELTKIYLTNYAEDEGVEYFIFINTDAREPKHIGSYIIFTKDQIPALIDQNRIGADTIKFTNLDPSLRNVRV
jgi:hypothetical protein